ncbi:MAG: hypothetical protein HXS48_05365 [Theionarchaea archaeon]|nr:MAG: hypothetical protein AYK19_07155 [Theionarchaea archaeon DG-70-1]MBU7026351.1 hypothetical protein [Theionarchaea archaeon]
MTMRRNISEAKYETTFLLRPVDGVGESMKAVLKCIFWRKPELSEPALKFLDFIKENQGVDDSLWERFCVETSITRGQYDSIIKKLRGSGLIYKRDGTWMLSDDFMEFLQNVLQIAKHWKVEGENQ